MSIIITCPSCGQKNRVKEEMASEKKAICGKCKQVLSWTTKPVVLTEGNFESYIATSEKPVLVDFWAQWCGPCHQMAPILEEFARLHPKIVVAKVDVDVNPNTAGRFQISSVPTLVLFENNQEVKRISGAASLNVLESHLNPWL